MRKLALAVRSFLTSEDGPTAVEYCVMLALVILACFAAITTFGARANSLFQKEATSLP